MLCNFVVLNLLETFQEAVCAPGVLGFGNYDHIASISEVLFKK